MGQAAFAAWLVTEQRPVKVLAERLAVRLAVRQRAQARAVAHHPTARGQCRLRNLLRVVALNLARDLARDLAWDLARDQAAAGEAAVASRPHQIPKWDGDPLEWDPQEQQRDLKRDVTLLAPEDLRMTGQRCLMTAV